MSAQDIEPEYKVRRGAVDVQALNFGVNSDGLSDTRDTRQIGPLVPQDGTNAKITGAFSLNKERALAALQSKGYKETMEQVAIRAGVSRKTLYRYLAGSTFAGELRRRVLLDIKGDYAPFMRQVLDSAMERGPGQAALVRVILDKIGDPVYEHHENVNTNIQAPYNIDDLSMSIRRMVADEIEAVARGEDVKWWTYEGPFKQVGPQGKLRPAPEATRNVTPLEEVELHPAPCDSITHS